MPRAGIRILLLTAAALAPFAGQAQDGSILLGAGVRSRPEYDGSSEQRRDVIPLVRYYGRPWFARTTQGILEGGLRHELAPLFWAGAQIAYEPGRDNPELDAGASVGLHLEWDRKFGRVPVNFLIRAREHLDAERGGQADLRINAGVYAGHGVQAIVFTQATWGTRNAVRSLYGPANSGLLFVSLGAGASLDLARHWVLLASAEQRRLRDEAEESPLAQRRSASYFSAGLAYRF
jgi:outer membrane scaffolding protein for murein synthesis (MipA/OmpV family)